MTTDTEPTRLADAALLAYARQEEQRRDEREQREKELRLRKAKEADEAMELARAAFRSRLRMSADQARDLVHLAHSRSSSRGPAVDSVVVAVPVERLPPNAVQLIVNWPNGHDDKAQIAVAERFGRSASLANYGKRIETLADLGEVIADRQEAFDRNTDAGDAE